MKGTAKCDNLCELQNSVSQESFECVLRFWATPERMPALVSMHFIQACIAEPCVCCFCGCARNGVLHAIAVQSACNTVVANTLLCLVCDMGCCAGQALPQCSNRKT